MIILIVRDLLCEDLSRKISESSYSYLKIINGDMNLLEIFELYSESNLL